MKLVLKTLGQFLVAACAFVAVVMVLGTTVIPSLSNYTEASLPERKNLEISSSIGADPDRLHAAPSDKDKYETSDYYYIYDSSLNGWVVSVKDENQQRYEPICETIYNVPVVSLNKTFENCKKLEIAPAIPALVKDMSYTFAQCTELGGVVTVYASPDSYTDCFSNTTNAIALSGRSSVLDQLKATGSNNNITVK